MIAAIPPRFDRPWLLGVFVVVLLGAIVLAIWAKATDGRTPGSDDWSWRADRAEPWGTVLVLTLMIVVPVAAFVGSRIGGGWTVLAVLLAWLWLLWRATGGFRLIRRVEVDEEGVELRTTRGRQRVRIGDIVAVTEPVPDGGDPIADDEPEETPAYPGATVLLRDGPWFRFPSDEQALRVARNLAGLVGQPWSTPEEPSEP